MTGTAPANNKQTRWRDWRVSGSLTALAKPYRSGALVHADAGVSGG